MDIVKFPCPSCGKSVAADAARAGRKVRCPHCQAVVVAPAAAVPTPAPIPVPVPAVVGHDPDALEFKVQPREEEDSIFAEAADDDVFGQAAPAPKLDDDLHPSPAPAALDFGLHDAPAPAPRAAKAPPSAVDDDAPAPVTVRIGADDAARLRLLLIFIIPYALLMTGLAVTFYVRSLSLAKQHPLELIPDVGEFRGTTKRSANTTSYLPKGDQELPPKLTVPLGGAVVIGDLEVQPIKIEQRPLVAFTQRKGRDEPDKVPFRKDSLVMTLKLTNRSTEWSFVPTDPVFDHRPTGKSGAAGKYHRLKIDGKFYQGGLVDYQSERAVVLREYADGQQDDDKPLAPGQSRTTVVCTHPDEPIVKALDGAKNAVWQVNLRRGMEPFRGEPFPVSAVVGVAFTPGEVRKLKR